MVAIIFQLQSVFTGFGHFSIPASSGLWRSQFNV
jgi:hypothetical protein